MLRPAPLHVSYANRPSHLYIRSDDAIDLRTTGSPSNFQLPLVENILDAKAAQLISAQIPLVIPQIPNYQRFFVYKTGPTTFKAFMFDHSIADVSYLYLPNYPAVVTQLNIDRGYTLTWTPGTQWTYNDFAAAGASAPDISFALDTTTRKITMTNISGGPITLASELEVQALFARGIIRKPYLYLNFLLGYDTLSSTVPTIAPSGVYTPPSFVKLAPTQTIYIRANFVMNGSQDSSQIKNILAAVPVEVPTLAIVSYQTTQKQLTFALPPTIGAIEISLFDDNNQPLNLPENAQTCFDIQFIYDEGF